MKAQTIGAIFALCFALAMTSAAEEGSDPPPLLESEANPAGTLPTDSADTHRDHLARFVGKWRGEVEIWKEEGAEPVHFQVTVDIEWILDANYLEWTYDGDLDGKIFEGRSLEGFDSSAGRYESVWIDNSGNPIVSYRGECSDDGSERTMTAELASVDAETPTQNRTVSSWSDDDHFRYTSFMVTGEAEFKNLEIAFTRR